jgi:5-(carboxyamino)imidazole ribonucleotide mutase
MKGAAEFLEELCIPYECTIVSAHRTPRRMFDYASSAIDRGVKVIIAGAGGAAHLPGMVAAITTLPVIGVPIKTGNLNGLDSLYSIVQMPAGVPVATVAINGARNAAILAAQIIALSDTRVGQQLLGIRDRMLRQVEEKARALEEKGYFLYLSDLDKVK